MSPYELESLTVKQLQSKLRERGLRCTGKKQELIDRLQAATSILSANHFVPTSPGQATKRRLIHDRVDDRGDLKRVKNGVGAEDLTHRIDQLFNQYRDEEQGDVMTEDGILSFFEELRVDPQDAVTLVFAYFTKAKTMCVFTREEFTRGMRDLGCGSVEALRELLPLLRRMLEEKHMFAKIYAFVFGYSVEAGQKSLATDVAIELWRLLLAPHFSLLDEWIEFTKSYGRKVISRDTWLQLNEFCKNIRTDFANYDENGAWPVMIDDFVGYMKEKRIERAA